MSMMRIVLFLVFAVGGMLLAACGSGEMIPPPQPSAVPSSTVLAQPSPVNPASSATPAVNTATPAAKATAQPPAPTLPPTPANPGMVLTSGPLTVRIEAPQDGATLKTSPVEVKGKAPAGTVISIEDLILVVKSDNIFLTTIKLEPGPNLIEFMASDPKGNQVFTTLTVYFEP